MIHQGSVLNKLFLLPLFVLLSMSVNGQGQDELSPLQYNFELTKQVRQMRTMQDIFVYSIDSIPLPLLDEFSTNKFKQYNAIPGNPNVTTTTEYRLWDFPGTTVLPDTVTFMLSRSYYVAVDTVAGDTITTMTPLDSLMITIKDLSAYPVTSTTDTVWPSYNIYDTLYLPSSPDTVNYPVPDLVQDSVKIHFVSSLGDNSIWQDNFAYWNYRYPIGPPTLGVATFDGLNEDGYPYDFINTTATGIADYLTSRPIFLGTKPNNTAYNPSDSIYLSFFYQPAGRGNSPETGDSLILEFWAPDSSKWFRIWGVPGAGLSSFKQVLVPITAQMFLEDGFKFRFKNIANLAGSLDHWHLDYVFLNILRNANDTVRSDVAFMYDENTLLKDYTAMPWEHYKWDPAGFMADTLSVYQRNNDNVARIIADQFLDIFHNGVPQQTINGPLHPSIGPLSNFSTVYDIQSSGFEFDTTLADTTAQFYVRFTFNPGSNLLLNDSTFFTQDFGCHYSYDDGTAEAAYGPQGAGAKLAYKFNVLQPDTLRAVRIHFEPNVNNVSNKLFLLTIWDANGAGGAPGTVIWQNTSLSTPVYVSENNGFYEYALDAKIVVNGNYYVGWQQIDVEKLNIGFDLNTNTQSKIYYNVTGSWANASFAGSLMMRPVFACGIDYLAGVEENFEEAESEIVLYPNPSQNYFMIRSSEVPEHVEMLDLSGRTVLSEDLNGKTEVNVNDVAEGIYLVRITFTDGSYGVRKLVVRK
jgi:hypothetical protein